MAKKRIVANKEKIVETNEEVKIPIKWHMPENIISRYASNVLVHALENEFLISFFEIKPEIRLDPNTPLPKEARADCIANIIMSPHKIPLFIDALTKQYNKFIKIKTKEQIQEQPQEQKS